MRELPINEWIVVFYPQTGSVRLCPTLDYAEQMLSSKSSFSQHVYRSPADFRQRYDHPTIEKLWKAAHKNAAWSFPKTATGKLEDWDLTPPDCGTEDLCARFWNMLQDIGDRVQAPVEKTKGSSRTYEFKLAEMKAFTESDDYEERYNNQSRVVFEALLNERRQILTEDEIRTIIYGLVASRRLKTRQEPWIIFQYYRPMFIKDGYVVRGGK